MLFGFKINFCWNPTPAQIIAAMKEKKAFHLEKAAELMAAADSHAKRATKIGWEICQLEPMHLIQETTLESR